MQRENTGQPVHGVRATESQRGPDGPASRFVDGSRGSNLLAIVSLGGSGCFVASALLLPAVSEYGIRQDFISELAIGRYGFVQTLAFVAFGIGALALAAGLRRSTKGSWGSLVGSRLVGLFGIGVLLDAAFPIDPGGRMMTVTGTVHLVAALAAFVCMVVAIRVFEDLQAERRVAFPPVCVSGARACGARRPLPAGRWGVGRPLPTNDVLKVRDGRDNDTADGGAGSDTCQRDPGDTMRSCP